MKQNLFNRKLFINKRLKRRRPTVDARTLALFVLTVFTLALPAQVIASASDLCDIATTRAASQEDVPLIVLKTISIAESGKNSDGVLRPWPWTINVAGNGKWFKTREEALRFATRSHARGARSFDVGCFQINYKWHHQNFASIADMFDPFQNALYAARFLKALYKEMGSWDKASGAYHSRTPKYANAYKARLAELRKRLELREAPPDHTPISYFSPSNQDPGSVQKSTLQARVNDFPFLKFQTGTLSLGSLVPLDGTHSGASLFAPTDEQS